MTSDSQHSTARDNAQAAGVQTRVVLRIERNPGHPQAALQVLGETDEWRGLVWEEAAIKMSQSDNDYDEDDY